MAATDGYARIDASVPGDRPTGFFDQGSLVFTSGANTGRTSEVLRHTRDGDGEHLELWDAMAEPIAAGDAFTVSAGCD